MSNNLFVAGYIFEAFSKKWGAGSLTKIDFCSLWAEYLTFSDATIRKTVEYLISNEDAPPSLGSFLKACESFEEGGNAEHISDELLLANQLLKGLPMSTSTARGCLIASIACFMEQYAQEKSLPLFEDIESQIKQDLRIAFELSKQIK